MFKVSLEGVRRLDMSLASETLVEFTCRYRRTNGFCLIDLTDKDILENIDAAAANRRARRCLCGKTTPPV